MSHPALPEYLTDAQVNNPTQLLVITEKWNKTANGSVNNESWMETFDGDMSPDPINPTAYPMAKMANWHQGGMNSSFFDGHAKWLKPSTIYDPTKTVTDPSAIALSRELTGCAIIHQYPTPRMCDTSDTSVTCTSTAPTNICNDPRFMPYAN